MLDMDSRGRLSLHVLLNDILQMGANRGASI